MTEVVVQASNGARLVRMPCYLHAVDEGGRSLHMEIRSCVSDEEVQFGIPAGREASGMEMFRFLAAAWERREQSAFLGIDERFGRHSIVLYGRELFIGGVRMVDLHVPGGQILVEPG